MWIGVFVDDAHIIGALFNVQSRIIMPLQAECLVVIVKTNCNHSSLLEISCREKPLSVWISPDSSKLVNKQNTRVFLNLTSLTIHFVTSVDDETTYDTN